MAGVANRTVSERDALVKISGISGYFASKSGGDTSVTTSEVRNGGSKVVEVISGNPVIANLVIGRPFNPARDLDLARGLRKQVGVRRDTVTTQFTDANGQAVGKPVVDVACLLVRVSWPKYDVNSNNAGMLELEYKPQSET